MRNDQAEDFSPCPFCGSNDLEHSSSPFSEFYGHEHQDEDVSCKSCNASLYVDSHSKEFPCSCCYDLASVLIERWNRRVTANG